MKSACLLDYFYFILLYKVENRRCILEATLALVAEKRKGEKGVGKFYTENSLPMKPFRLLYCILWDMCGGEVGVCGSDEAR